MSDSVIRVENLGKKYIIGHQQQGGYKTLRDAIAVLDLYPIFL
jgi:lipopolysaccharide transport system ATP-binding protein